MDWILDWLFVIAVGTPICLALDRVASWAIKKMLRPKVCHHPYTHTSYLTATTRCRQCGDILGQD